MPNCYQVYFSAETLENAKDILNTLTSKKLIVGGTILSGPSHFWWKGKEIDMENYCYVMGFTANQNRQEIEEEYAQLSQEEIPMVSFIKMEGNQKFLDYITENTNSK